MTTKIWTKEMVQELLERNDEALARAVIQIYQRQTTTEQSSQQTKDHNGIGFTAFDAPFLSAIAVSLPRYQNKFTKRQKDKVRPMMKKYWKQLLQIIESNGGLTEISTKKAKIKKPEPVAVNEPVGAISDEVRKDQEQEWNWGRF